MFLHRFAGVGEFENFVRRADGLNETQQVANWANLAAVNLPDKMTGFSLFFIVFQCGFGVSFCRPPGCRKVEKLRRTAETGRFYAGLPVLGSEERQIQNIRLR